ncbi:MAG TPA: leucyl/phenylalanyl-tRNA--protein transferase [Salinarimonas sp.]|nr:leucyl/phenylalanyl-tRNA--protein transferase [Salinarimonas sp.]
MSTDALPFEDRPAGQGAGPADGFGERPAERLRRWSLGLAYALRPNRIRSAPALLARTGALLLAGDRRLPVAADARDPCDGLCGLAGALDPDTLLEAYARGLFPFSHLGPLKWWAPRERMVLFFPELHIAKRLRRQIRNGGYTVTFDAAFRDVIRACARPRAGKVPLTWITPRIMAAYTAAHEAGHAHSFEVWNPAGALVGGGYGLAFGRVFSTESQFSLEPNTSKIGFTALNWHLARWGFVLNDGKHFTPTIDGMGFRAVPRADYTALCDANGRGPHRVGRWAPEGDLATVSEWRPAQA